MRELSQVEESDLMELRRAAEYLWGLIDNQEMILGTDKRALALAKAKLEESVDWANKGMC